MDLTASAEAPTVLVTHDFAEARMLADEVVVLEHGQIVQHGAPDAVAASPRSAFVADLTSVRPWEIVP